MKTRTRKTPDTYFELVKRFPLRPIRTEAEHRTGLDLVNELLARSNTLDRGESDYLEMLAGLLEKYEVKQFPIKDASPVAGWKLAGCAPPIWVS